jgi:lipid A 3-O-deacylase
MGGATDDSEAMKLARARALGAISCSLAAWMLAAAPVHAGQPVGIAASAGRFSALRGEPSYESGWEVRYAPRRFRWLPRAIPDLSPIAGAMATAQGALYVYGGFRFDLPLGEAWRLSPQWAAGLYYWAGERDLGGALEFRSGVELSRRLGASSRLGLTIYHLSNAGLYSRNPGTESVVLTFSTRP